MPRSSPSSSDTPPHTCPSRHSQGSPPGVLGCQVGRGGKEEEEVQGVRRPRLSDTAQLVQVLVPPARKQRAAYQVWEALLSLPVRHAPARLGGLGTGPSAYLDDAGNTGDACGRGGALGVMYGSRGRGLVASTAAGCRWHFAPEVGRGRRGCASVDGAGCGVQGAGVQGGLLSCWSAHTKAGRCHPGACTGHGAGPESGASDEARRLCGP